MPNFDSLIIAFDRALRTVTGGTPARRASPAESIAHETRISPSYAIQVKEILLASKDLDTETREFVGIVEEADVVKHSWRIRNFEDNKTYGGSSTISLGGVVLGGAYKFICDEVAQELAVSEKEKTTYVLKAIETAQGGAVE